MFVQELCNISSSVAESEYIRPSGGEAPSSRLIFRSYSQCGARVSAQDFENTSAYSLYFHGTFFKISGSSLRVSSKVVALDLDSQEDSSSWSQSILLQELGIPF